MSGIDGTIARCRDRSPTFHFDSAGQITGKYTYANYQRPRLFAVR